MVNDQTLKSHMNGLMSFQLTVREALDEEISAFKVITILPSTPAISHQVQVSSLGHTSH
jgi:hypothetical protein